MELGARRAYRRSHEPSDPLPSPQRPRDRRSLRRNRLPLRVGPDAGPGDRRAVDPPAGPAGAGLHPAVDRDAERGPSRLLTLDRHEVDELLDPAEQGGLEVVVRPDLRQDVLPRAGDVGLVAVRPAEVLADALLPLDAARDGRPPLQTEPVGLDRLPDVDERVTDDPHVLPGGGAHDRVGDAGLLGALHQVVDEYADPALRPRLEVDEVVGKVVDAAEELDDHTLDAQIVAPDLLDQLRVVTTLDEDPAGPGDACRGVRHRDRARRRALGAGRGGRAHRRGQDHRAAVQQEAGPEWEGPAALAPVLKGHGAEVALDCDDLAAPVGGDLFDDGADLRGRLHGATTLGGAPVGGEHVGAVAVSHGSIVPGATPVPAATRWAEKGTAPGLGQRQAPGAARELLVAAGDRPV